MHYIVFSTLTDAVIIKRRDKLRFVSKRTNITSTLNYLLNCLAFYIYLFIYNVFISLFICTFIM